MAVEMPVTLPMQAFEHLDEVLFSAAAMTAAVESLYLDELKPFGRILRKRVAERAQVATGREVAEVDNARLKAACEACSWLRIEPEEGGDWSALIVGRTPSFVDVYSPRDLYAPELWAAAAAYFGGLSKGMLTLPGGRYSCALEIAARQLPFIAGLSLGKLCHIVQLAISQKKILGYSNGAVVPYAHSQTMAKERCALQRQTCATSSRGGRTGAKASHPIANWDVVCAFMRQIFATHDAVPLSNIKRIFRTQFRHELSETSLGHSKLTELLQDSRLSGICTVRLQGHGYVVYPQVQFPAPAHRSGHAIRLADGLPAPPPNAAYLNPSSFSTTSMDASCVLGQCVWDATQAGLMGGCVTSQCPTTAPSTDRSADDAAGSEDLEWETDLPEAACVRSAESAFLSRRLAGETPSFTCASPAPAAVPSTPAYLFCSTPVSPLPPTPRLGFVSAPMAVDSGVAAASGSSWCLGAACAAPVASWGEPVSHSRSESRQLFCPDEPLDFEELSPSPRAPPVVEVCAQHPVRYGFLHVAPAPPTPVPGAATRARSVPKDVGSGQRTPGARRCPALPPRWTDESEVSGAALGAMAPPSPALTASPGYWGYCISSCAAQDGACAPFMRLSELV